MLNCIFYCYLMQNVRIDFMDKNDKRPSLQNSSLMGVAAIIVVGIFVICVIIVLAKGLFASNNSDVPDGLYTGTISSEADVPSSVDDAASADDTKSQAESDISADSSDENASQADSESSSDVDSDSSSDDSSEAETSGQTAYVTEYAYLRTEPDQNAEQLICMSPNLEVTVLETGFDGYSKVYFMNFGERLEGYVYDGYLSYAN